VNKAGASTLFAGAVMGAFFATVGYALVERSQNSAAGAGGGPVVLTLGHGLDQSHPVHLAIQKFADQVAEKSGGSLTVQISPNGQLGSEVECIELLQRGSLAMTKTSSGPLEAFVPSMAVFGVPYAFRDEAQFWKTLDGPIGAELLQSGEGNGLHGLCWYDAGARSFYTKSTTIDTPDDLKGLKLRVQDSRTALEMVKSLGGSPTPMNFGELYTGLQQGLVDGAENNPPSFETSRHFEVCKEYSLNEHALVPDVLLISTRWWDRLTPEQQGWIEEAALESSQFQRELWREKTAESLRVVEAAGVNVTRPDKGPFIERVQPMHDSLEGTVVGDLMDRINAQD
jgi:tripartite ATP-independent transporter DctP family solute receptor